MSEIPTVGGTLYYETHGEEGDPVVLVHGSWLDHRAWDRVVPGLAGSLRVLTYDRRGYGRSTAAAGPQPLAGDASDLAELLMASGDFPAHVVAHGYGGAVALRLAAEHPELLRSLVIHEPPCLGMLEDDPVGRLEADRFRASTGELQRMVRAGEFQRAARAFVAEYAEDPRVWEGWPEELREAFARGAPQWSEEAADPGIDRPVSTGLRDFLQPALLTDGSASPGVLRRMTEALLPHLRNSRLALLPDVGHLPHLTRPDQYVALLFGFLVERDVPTM